MLFGRYRILRYQHFHLIRCELKHEIIRKTIRIPFDLLPRTDWLHFKKQSQVPVEHHLNPPYGMDSGDHLLCGHFERGREVYFL